SPTSWAPTCSWMRATRPNPSASSTGTWATGRAWRCAPRPGRSSSTWRGRRKTGACGCSFPWGSRFEDQDLARPAGFWNLGVAAHRAGAGVGRGLRRLVRFQRGGHPLAVAHGGGPARWRGPWRARQPGPRALRRGAAAWSGAGAAGPGWPWRTLSAPLDGEVHGVRGTLVHGLYVEGLSLGLADADVRVVGLHLKALWPELLDRRLHINDLSAVRVD